MLTQSIPEDLPSSLPLSSLESPFPRRRLKTTLPPTVELHRLRHHPRLCHTMFYLMLPPSPHEHRRSAAPPQARSASPLLSSSPATLLHFTTTKVSVVILMSPSLRWYPRRQPPHHRSPTTFGPRAPPPTSRHLSANASVATMWQPTWLLAWHAPQHLVRLVYRGPGQIPWT